MAQRIQAPLNAGLCLIISREGLSVVLWKERVRQKVRGRRERQLAGRAEEEEATKRRQGKSKHCTRRSRSWGRERKREREMSLWPRYFSHRAWLSCV